MPSAAERGQAEGKCDPVPNGLHPSQPGRLVNQVEGSHLVIWPPAAPIGHPGGQFGERSGDRSRDGDGHGPLYPKFAADQRLSFSRFEPIPLKCDLLRSGARSGARCKTDRRKGRFTVYENRLRPVRGTARSQRQIGAAQRRTATGHTAALTRARPLGARVVLSRLRTGASPCCSATVDTGCPHQHVVASNTSPPSTPLGRRRAVSLRTGPGRPDQCRTCRPELARGCRSLNFRSTRSCRRTPRPGRLTLPPTVRSPTPPPSLRRTGQPGVRARRQLRRHRVRVLAGRRIRRDGRRLHAVGRAQAEPAGCRVQPGGRRRHLSAPTRRGRSSCSATPTAIFRRPSRGRTPRMSAGRSGLRRRRWWPARLPAIRSTARARPTAPTEQVTSTGGQYPYPTRCLRFRASPTRVGSGGGHGRHPRLARLLGGPVGRIDLSSGDAVNYGSMAGASLAAPITHLVPTPNGKGYWMVAGDGGIFAFGDAGFYGSMGGQPLNAPVVDLAPTADGKGYWLVGSDGGIFAFGDARFYGSMGGQHLNAARRGHGRDDAKTGGLLDGRRPTAASSPSTPRSTGPRGASYSTTGQRHGPHCEQQGLLAGRVGRRHLRLRNAPFWGAPAA